MQFKVSFLQNLKSKVFPDSYCYFTAFMASVPILICQRCQENANTQEFCTIVMDPSIEIIVGLHGLRLMNINIKPTKTSETQRCGYGV